MSADNKPLVLPDILSADTVKVLTQWMNTFDKNVSIIQSNIYWFCNYYQILPIVTMQYQLLQCNAKLFNNWLHADVTSFSDSYKIKSDVIRMYLFPGGMKLKGSTPSYSPYSFRSKALKSGHWSIHIFSFISVAEAFKSPLCYANKLLLLFYFHSSYWSFDEKETQGSISFSLYYWRISRSVFPRNINCCL